MKLKEIKVAEEGRGDGKCQYRKRTAECWQMRNRDMMYGLGEWHTMTEMKVRDT